MAHVAMELSRVEITCSSIEVMKAIFLLSKFRYLRMLEVFAVIRLL